MLDNLKINTRLSLIVFGIFLCLIAQVSFGLSNLKKNLYEDREAQVRSIVQSVNNLLKSYEARAKSGELTEEMAKKEAIDGVNHMTYGKGDYVWLNDMGGAFIAHPNKKLIGVNSSQMKDPDGVFFVQKFVETAKNGGGYVSYRWERDAGKPPVQKISYVEPFAAWNWVIGTGIYIDDVDSVFMDNVLSLGGMSLAIFLLAAGGSLFVSRSITIPLGSVTGAMNELANGNKKASVGFAQNKSEIGDLARSFETFRHNAIEMEEMEKKQQHQKELAAKEQKELLQKLADDFEKSVKGVVSSVSVAATQVQNSAQQLSKTSEETNEQASAVSAAAEEASTNVQTVASAAEELDSSINEINRQIGESVNVASTCVAEAEATSVTMQELSKAAEDIGAVVQLIESIARQVNLLALNATIEAARAGEAGRGFAVVANEVKTLANQTGKAAKEITVQIADIQQRTGKAVVTIDGITKTIKRINEISTAIAAAVEEQGSATKEISRSIQETAAGTKEVTRNISGVSHSVSETGTAANLLLDTSETLVAESTSLSREVDGFLRGIRAN